MPRKSKRIQPPTPATLSEVKEMFRWAQNSRAQSGLPRWWRDPATGRLGAFQSKAIREQCFLTFFERVPVLQSSLCRKISD